MKRTLTGTALALLLAGSLSGCGTTGANPAPSSKATTATQVATPTLDKTQEKVLKEVIDTLQKHPERLSAAVTEYGSLRLGDKELAAPLPTEAQSYQDSSRGLVSEASWNFLRITQVPYDSLAQSWAGILYVSEICSDLPGFSDKDIRSNITAQLLQANPNRVKNASADTIKILRYLLITQAQNGQGVAEVPKDKLEAITGGLPTLAQAAQIALQKGESATVGSALASQSGQQMQLPMAVKVPKTAYAVRLQTLEDQAKEYQDSQMLPAGDLHRILQMPLEELAATGAQK